MQIAMCPGIIHCQNVLFCCQERKTVEMQAVDRYVCVLAWCL